MASTTGPPRGEPRLRRTRRLRPADRSRRLFLAALGVVVLAAGGLAVGRSLLAPRVAPSGDPPVLAGQQLWGSCAGGFHARRGDTIVVTSSGHCTIEGTVAYETDGATIRGVFGPAAHDAACPYPDHICAQSDMNILFLAADRIPWGRLNVVDLGSGGKRVIQPGTRPLGCADIGIGDTVEINGRNTYRTGTVAEKGQNLFPNDDQFFPCMIASRIQVTSGDSGGAVLVRGLPAGVTSRSFGGLLGFTPLAEGLAQLGLELCATPNCDLVPPPVARPASPP